MMFYHATSKKLIPIIKKVGLKPGKPGVFGGKGGVYLTRKLSAARGIARQRHEQTDEPQAILAVDIKDPDPSKFMVVVPSVAASAVLGVVNSKGEIQ